MKKEMIFKIIEVTLATLVGIGTIWANIKSSKMTEQQIEDISNRVAIKLYNNITHSTKQKEECV